MDTSILAFALRFFGFLILAQAAMAEGVLTKADLEMISRYQEASLEAIGGDPARGSESSEPIITVFISESLGESLIRDSALEAKALLAQGIGVRLVLRGFLPGESFRDSMTRNLGRLRDWDALDVPLLLDPPAFKEHFIDRVPVVIRQEGSRVTDRVEGTVSPTYIVNQLSNAGRNASKPNLHPVVGEVFPIAEEDLIEKMKGMVANIDWKDHTKRALKRYWKNKQYVSLPPATSSSSRNFNPSIRVDEDIVVEGKLIAKAGTVINPFDMVPLVTSYLVFNPSRPHEMAYASDQVERFKNRPLMLIATEFPRDKTLEQVLDLQDIVKAPIYLLDDAIKSRFKVKATPTLIVPDSHEKVFQITEERL